MFTSKIKWIVVSFVLGCIVASMTGCRVGQQELIHTARVEHVEFWHSVDQSNSKATLELKYRYTF
jgi:hypothetical protein